ncbi:MAG: hypothetical protein J6F30_03085 [Cellulosilyticum sp.]|nr:hypothetical protein [Cellulosilyticum sp.]
MPFDEMIKMVLDSSVTIAVLAYFMYRDNKFMSKLEITLQALVDTVNVLKEKVSEE